MPQLKFSKHYLKDVKRWKKSGRNMKPLDEFVRMVKMTWPPPAKYEGQLLSGTFEGTWDVPLRQNWVLLLHFKNDTVYFLRMGTHADLGL